jgi:hypothetical protein
MKIYCLFLLILVSSCSITKENQVKIPNYPKGRWFTKKSLNKFCEEFAKKDWSYLDTISYVKYDSLNLNF